MCQLLGAGATITPSNQWTVGSLYKYSGNFGLRIAHPGIIIANASTLPTGMRMWFRADAGVVTSGTKVTQWSDQSGNGFHMSAVNGGPDLVPNVASDGQLPVIRFSGTTAGLRTTNVAATVTTPYTMFTVARYQTARPSGVLIHSQDRV